MRAEYDSQANAISIDLVAVDHWDGGEHAHDRANVAFADGRVANVEILYPDLGLDEPITLVAARYALDVEALKAAARSALEAPDRVIELDVHARTTV